jgi:hypothetical protein
VPLVVIGAVGDKDPLGEPELAVTESVAICVAEPPKEMFEVTAAVPQAIELGVLKLAVGSFVQVHCDVGSTITVTVLRSETQFVTVDVCDT